MSEEEAESRPARANPFAPSSRISLADPFAALSLDDSSSPGQTDALPSGTIQHEDEDEEAEVHQLQTRAAEDTSEDEADPQEVSDDDMVFPL